MLEMQSAGVQVLESCYIIATSKNIDTIKGRYAFLLQRISNLKNGQGSSQYPSFTQLMRQQYESMYFDRPLRNYQLAIISNPNGFDLNDFYCNSILSAMQRFCADQVEE